MDYPQSISIYIHIPFCRSRCTYCDFNTYAGMEAYLADYTQALKKELYLARPLLKAGEFIHTIYFGGGTPTILQPETFSEILASIREEYPLTEAVEITTEANPLLLTEGGLQTLRQAGVERLSMGMQSGISAELKLLGRRHNMADVIQSMTYARQAGFENINLDLIFGVPGQSLKSLRESLEKALALQPEHLSIYSLTVEEGTPLARMLAAGQVELPDPDVVADMYEWLMDYLPSQGFDQYEISNWAKGKEFQSRHNLQYWHNYPYLGFGAGAHSYFKHYRWANVMAIPNYIDRMQTVQEWELAAPPAAEDAVLLTEWDEIQERMMMGLRLTEEGISMADFRGRFGKGMDEIYPKEITFLIKNGLLEWVGKDTEKRLRLTRRGRMLGNQVFMQFIEG
jgi:oxygen-independent coproporphyrinogen-3 oxidase